MRRFGAVVGATVLVFGLASPALADGPTCSDFLPVEVHGQHIVGDYVAGVGHGALGWPPDGASVGEAVSETGGAAVPGGPGPGFHFPNGFAPGASFCIGSPSSPGNSG
jgi:hypothetical protein